MNKMAISSIENLFPSDSMYDASLAISAATAPLQRDLPTSVRRPLDLLKIPKRPREGFVDTYYGLFKTWLFNLDDPLDDAIARLGEGEIDVKEVEESVEEMKQLGVGIKIAFVKTEKIYRWCDDNVLLSTILLHSKLLEKVLARHDKKYLKKLEDREGVLEIQKFLREHRDIGKALLIIILEPLLVFGVLVAYLRGEFKHVLKYEKEVTNALRTLSNHNPDLIELLWE